MTLETYWSVSGEESDRPWEEVWNWRYTFEDGAEIDGCYNDERDFVSGEEAEKDFYRRFPDGVPPREEVDR